MTDNDSTVSDDMSVWRLEVQMLQVWGKFCSLYCENDHVDFCDARDIPGIGDLNEKFPIGRFWRFQVIDYHSQTFF